MRFLGAFAFAAAMAAATPALAQSAHFVLTGAEQAEFDFVLHPTASQIDAGGFQQFGSYDPTLFGVTLNGTLNGTAQQILLHFYTDAGGGGLDVIGNFGDGFFRISPIGPTLFTGTVDDPTFVVGEYDFDGDYDFPNDRTYHLSITSAATPAVPEPATWSMMILGFGAVGGALRRRRTTGAVLATATI